MPDWRGKASLERLVHAALVEYPRYWDPVSGRVCPVEVVLDRLVSEEGLGGGPVNRGLAKLQGLLAGWAWMWR